MKELIKYLNFTEMYVRITHFGVRFINCFYKIILINWFSLYGKNFTSQGLINLID